MLSHKRYCMYFMPLMITAVCLLLHGPSSQASEMEAKDALKKFLAAMKDLQRNGGWAMSWASDFSATFGEHRLRPDDVITVQPPATPGIGLIYLRAYEVLGDKEFLSTAIAAGDALLSGQLPEGGFPHEFRPGEQYERSGTFDDDTTQRATLFLIALWKQSAEERFEQAAKRCAEFMRTAQYENGGWPQAYPLRDNYSRYITLNDQAIMDVIRTLLICHKTFGDQRDYEAAMRGVECLLNLRSDPPQAGWAQQYTVEGEPASARRFEPVGLSSAESLDVLRLLKDIYLETGDKKYLQAGLPTFDWLRRSRLPNGLWSRLYEIGTNEPIYSDEQGNIIRDVKNARPGYGWQGRNFDENLEKLYKRLLDAPEDSRHEIVHSEPPSLDQLLQRAQEPISTLNPQGYWCARMGGSTLQFYQEKFGTNRPVPELISSGLFTRNAGILLDYLQALQ